MASSHQVIEEWELFATWLPTQKQVVAAANTNRETSSQRQHTSTDVKTFRHGALSGKRSPSSGQSAFVQSDMAIFLEWLRLTRSKGLNSRPKTRKTSLSGERKKLNRKPRTSSTQRNSLEEARAIQEQQALARQGRVPEKAWLKRRASQVCRYAGGILGLPALQHLPDFVGVVWNFVPGCQR